MKIYVLSVGELRDEEEFDTFCVSENINLIKNNFEEHNLSREDTSLEIWEDGEIIYEIYETCKKERGRVLKKIIEIINESKKL